MQFEPVRALALEYERGTVASLAAVLHKLDNVEYDTTRACLREIRGVFANCHAIFGNHPVSLRGGIVLPFEAGELFPEACVSAVCPPVRISPTSYRRRS